MTIKMKLSFILLAAGSSSRFPKNKLLYLWKGKPIYKYAIDNILKIPSYLVYKKVVVTQYKEIMDYAKHCKFDEIIFNPKSEMGISYSIKLGLQAVKDAEAYCFCVCDQPDLNSDTIIEFLTAYSYCKKGIMCLSYKERLGNPVIFSHKYQSELSTLQGDIGGKQIIKNHMDDIYKYEVINQNELKDIDTIEDVDVIEGIDTIEDIDIIEDVDVIRNL